MSQTFDAEKLVRKFLPPMLATASSSLPSTDDDWVYELKYDGFRAVAAVTSGGAVLWSRNGIDLRPRFPHLGDALEAADLGSAVLDCEIIAFDPNGAPRFELIQQGSRNAKLVVFDLLSLEGEDLRRRPLEVRREELERLFADSISGAPKTVREAFLLAERHPGPASEALSQASSRGYEGLIAKRRGTRYESRRSKSWLKLKAQNAQEMAVVGFTPSKRSDQEIGSLVLAVSENGSLRFAGKVGTGFSSEQRQSIMKALKQDRITSPPVEKPPRIKDVTWVRPRLVAQVRFTEWTSDGKLRHPAFLGFRADKTPDEVVREASALQGERPMVKMTHPERLLYPKDGIRKIDVANYYEAVAEPMIHALAERPVALEHWNQGVGKPPWFQQNIGDEAEEWMTLVDTPTRTSRRVVRHLVVDRRETLHWLAQHSVLTIHMWSSRAPHLERPDWLIFDLDPAKGKGIEQAVQAALVFRKLFDKMEIPSVPKTSGKRGIHLFVPLAPGYSHEEAVEFACQLSGAVASEVPDITVERSLSKRKGRLYADCLQNGYGKTVVAPYSLRGIDGAPVSAPLKWSEVTRRLDPSRYNLKTMAKRLDKEGDLFAPVLEQGIRLPKLK